MKNFNSWGIRIRKDFSRNYYSIWQGLVTERIDLGEIVQLQPERSEFYDVGITERCNAGSITNDAGCKFCYVSASPHKKDYENICETWNNWMQTFPPDVVVDLRNVNDLVLLNLLGKPEKDEGIEERILRLKITLGKVGKFKVVYTEKPFQVAIGSVGEPTMHSKFPEFLETVYNSNIVPNYTTNGIILADYDKSKKIFETTFAFCGGVAVSYGNTSIRSYANRAISNLLKYGNCKVMIHHIIKDKASVGELLKAHEQWGKDIHYHVLLPLMAHGRSKEAMDDETFIYLCEQLNKRTITNVAFGANFLPFMKKHPNSLKVWEYPQEIYSKNILLKDNKVVITPSSFNLTTIKEITF